MPGRVERKAHRAMTSREEALFPQRGIAGNSKKLVLPVLIALVLDFWAAWDAVRPPLLWIYRVFWAMTLLAYMHVVFIKAGSIPLGYAMRASDVDHQLRKKYCNRCHGWKPQRCHHCSVCNECVLVMDHHCVWIGHCIGFGNRKYFVQFISYVWLTGVTFLIGLCQSLFLKWPNLSSFARLFSVGFIGIASLAAWKFWGFVRYHVRLVQDNLTTLEEMFTPPGGENKYDCGWRINLEMVFGPILSLAWVPLNIPALRPVGDGTVFATQKMIEFEPLLAEVEVSGKSERSSRATSFRKNDSLHWAAWVGGASWDVEDEDLRDTLLAELFDLHDLDGSGTISKEDLTEVSRKLGATKEGVEDESLVVPKGVSKVFAAFDADKDGQISRQDFCEYYNKQISKTIEDPRGQLYMLERALSDLRAARGLPPLPSRSSSEEVSEYDKGEKVLLWSESGKQWVEGKVDGKYDRDCFSEGYAVMAGSYKIKTRKGIKWIAPGQVSELMKKVRGEA